VEGDFSYACGDITRTQGRTSVVWPLQFRGATKEKVTRTDECNKGPIGCGGAALSWGYVTS